MIFLMPVSRKISIIGLAWFAAAAVLVGPAHECQALTVKSDVEGNIFTDKQKMTFQVSDFTGTVRYELRDYFDAIVASGKSGKQNTSLIAIPSPGPGHYMLTCHDDVDTVRVAAGVVIDRGDAPLPREGRVCGQSSAQWLLKDEAGYNRLARILAEKFKDADIAWEIGIEPDMNGVYWFDLGDLVAGFHKAAYLGIKDGDPDVPVLPASITLGPTTFLENMLDSGIGDYSDMFNWHIYDKPSRYPERAEHYRQLLSRYGMADAPDWLTEFGVALRNSDGPNQTNLSYVDQQTQCRFVAQSITMALAAGADKAFYFLIPGIHDPKGEEFGLMYADLSPYPGYIAPSDRMSSISSMSGTL